MKNLILILFCILLGIVGQFFLKRGMQIIGPFPLIELGSRFSQIVFSPLVFIGLALYFLSAVFWLAVLSRVDLSLAYPMISVGYVFVVLFSSLVFKEQVSWIRWLGVATICLGVYFVSRS